MAISIKISIAVFTAVLMLAWLGQVRIHRGLSIPIPITSDEPRSAKKSIIIALILLGISILCFDFFLLTKPKMDWVLVPPASLIFLIVIAPVMVLSIERWRQIIKDSLSANPTLRASMAWLCLMALLGMYSSAYGVSTVKSVAIIGALGLSAIWLVSSRPVATNIRQYPLRLMLAIMILWVPLEYRIVPAFNLPPKNGLLSLVEMLFVDAGLLLFLVLAPLSGIGYSFNLRRRDVLIALIGLGAFAAVAIPLGVAIGFIHWNPRTFEPVLWLAMLLGMYFLTAIPEELVFRGLIQNMVESHWSGQGRRVWSIVIASIIFGFAHINRGHAPNFRYVMLAAIAGLFYGWVWQKTRSISASAVTHALVDWIWRNGFHM